MVVHRYDGKNHQISPLEKELAREGWTLFHRMDPRFSFKLEGAFYVPYRLEQPLTEKQIQAEYLRAGFRAVRTENAHAQDGYLLKEYIDVYVQGEPTREWLATARPPWLIPGAM